MTFYSVTMPVTVLCHSGFWPPLPPGEGRGEGPKARVSLPYGLWDTNQRVVFFAVGVENANMARLGQLVVRTPMKLKGLHFAEMFVWLSASMQKISQSKPDDIVALPPPGWGTV